MKKYLLFLTSLGLLIIFGLASFIKAVKSDTEAVKKVIQKESPIPASILNRQLLASEFEKDLSPQATEKLDQASKEELLQNISELPLIFQKNMGQWPTEVLYRTACPTAKVSLMKKGLSFFSMRELEEHDEDDTEEEDNAGEEEMYEKMVWNLNFKGMNAQSEIVAEGEVAGVTNYFLGKDSSKWVRNAPESKLINYKEIYDHIDLHYYGLAGNKLKYDYILKPGANITSIQMELDGAGGLTINNNGELVIETPWGKVAEDKPYSYQIINGVKREIDIRYHILDDKTFGFAAYGQYDKNYDLVIDPKTLVWSTYAKGLNATFYVQDIGIDASRNVYITGWTDDGNGGIPITAGAAQGTFGGSLDAFVCKFNRRGTQLLYSTFLGGSQEERTYSIAVHSGGNAYITGRTDSNSDYPTFSAAYPTSPGSTDIFIAGFNGTGGFIYSTFFGGGSSDEGKSIFVNASNEVYVTGKGQKSSSPNLFPTTAGVVYPNGTTSGIDAFVAKFSSTGTLIFSTMLGGSSEDLGYGIYVPTTGEIYVTGYTKGNFAAPNATPTYGAFNSGQDAFVAKLTATATSLTYLAYLSGGANDVGFGVHVRNGEAYISGTTTSTNFPTTAGVVQTANAGGTDLFVTKLNTTGTALVYSTYLGGALNESVDDDRASDIFVNNNGEAYVSTTTTSTDYPTVPPAASGYDPSYNAGEDGAISLVSIDGKKLLCSTYFGGAANDYKRLAIVVDITNALQDTLYGSVTSHSPDIPIVQTQGAVYGPTKVNGGDDQPVIFKMVSCMVPLPVELMSFTGANKGDYNLLEWTTATEKNNDYFTLERSSDGINFLAVGMVDGSGNSSSILNYSYSDPKDGEEIIYYRLKQTDFNGQISYSGVVAINAAEVNKALELTVFSPVTDRLNYKVCCVHKGNAQVEVIDMSGRIVISSTVHVNEGSNKLTLDSKILAEGLYILKFTADNGTVKVKFVK